MCKQIINDDKNAGKLLAILIAMWMPQHDTWRIAHGAHLGLHSKPLDADIEQVSVPYCPGGHHGHRF
jgi:hypothetical protein